MPHRNRKLLVAAAALVWSGCLLGRALFPSPASSEDASVAPSSTMGRRLLQLVTFQDPKSTGPRPEYVIHHEPQMMHLKNNGPTIFRERPDDGNKLVIDVLSIGSETRVEYLTAQLETWASHINIRNFWGVSERQDFALGCPQMTDDDLKSYYTTCKNPMGWEPKYEQFRKSHFGIASGVSLEQRLHQPGWFCAQRRPGRALGWLQSKYGKEGVRLPDMLLLVDDDTSVDVDMLQKLMEKATGKDSPSVYGGCVFNLFRGFAAPFGGFGTFFNRDALQKLTQPIHCDQRQKDSPYLQHVCAALQNNKVGELAVFQMGDSVLEVFYKYAGLQNYCMHSDWLVGYMVSNYSGGSLQNIVPRNVRKCRKDPCTLRSVTCHNQTPKHMIEFTQSRAQQAK